MPRCGFIIAAFLLLFFGASSTSAQHSYEVTPFGGTRFGGRINFNPPASNEGSTVDYVSIKSTFDYGLLFDYGIWPGFQAEFMWNHQPTELGAHDVPTGVISNLGPASLDMYQWGALWELRGEEARLKPFAVLGFGFTHFNTNGSLSNFSNRFAYNLGGGVKYSLNRHFGLRAEVRYSPSRTTQSTVTFVDQFGNFFTQTQKNYAKQGQANLGVIFRF